MSRVDKLTNLLTDWTQYASPLLGFLPTHTFMMVVGIALNLVTTGKYFDVAVRDVVMAASAFVLAKLTEAREA